MFEGIKIVELAQWVFVPAAGAVFSNLGAEVVKIERLGGGDPLRGLFTASLGQQSGPYNPRVEQNNSGKKSLAVDIGTAEGLEILFRLIEQADVFLTNFRSSTLTALRPRRRRRAQRATRASSTPAATASAHAVRTPTAPATTRRRSGRAAASARRSPPPTRPSPSPCARRSATTPRR